MRLQGFQSLRRSEVKLDVGQVARLDFELRPGTLETQIDVTADAPLVNAANAELGTVVDNKRVQELPLERSYYHEPDSVTEWYNAKRKR